MYEKALQIALQITPGMSINSIVEITDLYIESSWEEVFHAKYDELTAVYQRMGNLAYGTYLSYLMGPIFGRLHECCYQFPGTFTLDDSQEWGSSTYRNRMYWRLIRFIDKPIGGLIVELFQNHTKLSLPTRPRAHMSDAIDLQGVVKRAQSIHNARNRRFTEDLYFHPKPKDSSKTDC
ncbi:hypothetical protein SAMN05444392_107175 [Seinonella peptonophila]|uniref:Uncharacterized protein n=1 Tax=Seinonella peptonophila TaxID=112248 RepID=A0A1M4YWA3_9BACL|nr:DUF6022 family protein [Seinonella peptonophila]SHF09837.1 hypothetical protein SAMN05444392_107175 [Seinonella peptonophila]